MYEVSLDRHRNRTCGVASSVLRPIPKRNDLRRFTHPSAIVGELACYWRTQEDDTYMCGLNELEVDCRSLCIGRRRS
jgi:hypothetical protein